MLYVAGEIFLWMALAFVLGILVGWFVWGVRRRSTGAKPAGQAAEAGAAAGAATTASGDIESVTVRPAVKPVTEDTAPALPVTPPAGTPVVRATPSADDTTAEVEIVPPPPPVVTAPDSLDEADEGDAAPSPQLAALVADDAGDALNDRV